MPVSSVQYGQQPWKYANGLKISNDSVAPDTIVNVAIGSILDSTGVFQLENDAVLSADIGVSGLNGLDTGAVAASKVYALHLIADPITFLPMGLMFSLSATAPLMPFGYSAFALLGYVVTDSSSDILLGNWSAGNSARRQFVYDAPIIALSAGAATSYTGVALTVFVPAVADTQVAVNMLFAANAAGNSANLQGYNAVGDQVSLIAPVATGVANTAASVSVLAQLNSAAPSIKYKVSAGALSLYVAGFSFDI